MPPHKLKGRSIIDKVRIDVDRRVDNVTTQSLTSAYYCRSGLLLQAGEKLILTVRYNSFLFSCQWTRKSQVTRTGTVTQ